MLINILLANLISLVSGADNCYTCPNACSSKGICTRCSAAAKRFANMEISSKYRYCPCDRHYYDDGVNEKCLHCVSPCINCVQDAHRCTECDTSGNREDYAVNYACPCKQRYYMAKGGTSCTRCDSSCLECRDLPTSCTLCNTLGTFRLDYSEIDHTCPCQDGYYHLNNERCFPCLYPCITCERSASNCLSCPLNMRLENFQCVQCQTSEYGVGSVCLQCSKACLGCEIYSYNCLDCPDPKYNRIKYDSSKNLNLCECRDGYFDVGFVTCLKCSKQCKTCDQREDKCTSCDTSGVRDDQSKYTFSCPCKRQYFENSDGDCVVCHPTCGSCVGTKIYQCLTCQPQYTMQPYRVFYDTMIGNCITTTSSAPSSCLDGYYEIKGVCLKCMWMCATCLDKAESCTQCQIGLLLDQNLGTCSCPVGLTLVARSCQMLCQLQTYYNETTTQCQKCDAVIPNCQVCMNAEITPFKRSVQCALCSFSYKVQNGKCSRLNQNDLDSIDIDCAAKQAYTIFEGQEPRCIKCPPGCDDCLFQTVDPYVSFRTICTSCQALHRIDSTLQTGNNRLCTSQCGENRYLNNMNGKLNCEYCPAGCLTCVSRLSYFLNGVQQTIKCLSCGPDYKMVDGICQCTHIQHKVSNCLNRLIYLSKNGQACGTCPSDCDGCYYMNMKYLHCPNKECIDGLLVEGRPYQQCIQYRSSEMSCTIDNKYDVTTIQCTSSTQVNSTDTSKSCEQITNCIQCLKDICIQCKPGFSRSIDGTACSQRQIFEQNICPDGFYLNITKKQSLCSSCPPNCDYCDKKTGECLRCFIRYSLINTKCILTQITAVLPYTLCGLASYYDFEQQKCLQCSINGAIACLRCNPNGCIECSQGYYPNKTCLPCGVNCQACRSATWCDRCKEGFYKTTSFDHLGNEYISVCARSCPPGDLAILSSQLTENLDQIQQFQTKKQLYDLLFTNDDLMQRLPSAAYHDLQMAEQPIGIDQRGQAIYLNDGILINKKDSFSFSDYKNQRIVCAPCQRRCKKCIKYLNTQSQMCVDDCRFPSYNGNQTCDQFQQINSYSIQHISEIIIPYVKSTASFQDFSNDLILNLQNRGTDNFQVQWIMKKQQDSTKDSFDSILQNYDAQLTDYYDPQIDEYMASVDTGKLQLKVPKEYLTLNAIYQITAFISSIEGNDRTSKVIHILDGNQILQKQSILEDNLQVVDFDLIQQSSVLFYYYDLIPQPYPPFVRVFYYHPSMKSNLPLWCLNFDNQQYGFGYFEIPPTNGPIVIQMTIEKPLGPQHKLINANGSTYIDGKYTLVEDINQMDFKQWKLDKLGLDEKTLVNEIIQLIGLQIESYYQFNENDCSSGMLTKFHFRQICHCHQGSESTQCQYINSNRTTIHEDRYLNATIFLMLFIGKHQHQFSNSQVVSAFYTLTHTQSINPTNLYYLLQVVIRLSSLEAGVFQPFNIVDLRLKQKETQNLGDVGMYWTGIANLGRLVQWSYLQYGKQLKNNLPENFLRSVQRMLMIEIQRLNLVAIKDKENQGTYSLKLIKGLWKKFDITDQEIRKITFIHIKGFQEVPSVLIPTNSIPFRQEHFTFTTTCVHPTHISSFFYGMYQPLSWACSFQIYNKDSKTDLVEVYDRFRIAFKLQSDLLDQRRDIFQNDNIDPVCVVVSNDNTELDYLQCELVTGSYDCECYFQSLQFVLIIEQKFANQTMTETLNSFHEGEQQSQQSQSIDVELTNIFPAPQAKTSKNSILIAICVLLMIF